MSRLTGLHTGDPLENAYQAKLSGWKTLLVICQKQQRDGRLSHRVYRIVNREVLREALQNTLQALDEEAIGKD